MKPISKKESNLVSDRRWAKGGSLFISFVKRQISKLRRRQPIELNEPDTIRFSRKKNTSQNCGGKIGHRHLIKEVILHNYYIWIMCESCGKKIDYLGTIERRRKLK